MKTEIKYVKKFKLIGFYFNGQLQGKGTFSLEQLKEAVHAVTYDRCDGCDISLVEIVKNKRGKEEHISIFNRSPYENLGAMRQRLNFKL